MTEMTSDIPGTIRPEVWRRYQALRKQYIPPGAAALIAVDPAAQYSTIDAIVEAYNNLRKCDIPWRPAATIVPLQAIFMINPTEIAKSYRKLVGEGTDINNRNR